MRIQKQNINTTEGADFLLCSALIKGLIDINLLELSSDSIKKSFWINIYNGLSSWLVINNKLGKSTYRSITTTHFYHFNIGGYILSLDEIEHGILRQNRRMPLFLRRPFSKKSRKQPLLIELFDNRIHFALNCGGPSCPNIKSYTPENIDFQLEEAERIFASKNFIYDIEFQRIAYSKIYQYYKKDFPNKYLSDPQLKKYRKTIIPFKFV